MTEATGRRAPRPHYGTKRYVRRSGYVDVWEPTHPLARNDGYVAEHRKMAWDAGMLTDPALQVHHRNGLRADNRLENFEILNGTDHALHHAEERGRVTNQYGTFPVAPREQRRTAPRPECDCAFCHQPIPLSMRRDARYCSPICRLAAHRQRVKEAKETP